ncbi:MAG: GMC oxidoreductase [Pseudomonadota bacterium]
MIYDFDFLNSQPLPPVAIVGSGPAGVSLSKTLAQHGIPNLILEAGGVDWSDELQETCRGEVVGDEYWELEFSRLKYFGGSSNHWTGFCRPLDTVDFARRDDIEDHIGWPIQKSDLDPFQSDANEILELPSVKERNVDKDLKEVEFAKSPPVNFAEKYRTFFETSDLSHVCLNANVLSLTAENGRVVSIEVSNLAKDTISVRPKTVVLCMGGIENSRLLLWSNEVSPEPVVQRAETLGKYWMDHPHNIGGHVEFTHSVGEFSFPWSYSFFAPTEEAMRRYQILNACVRVRYGRDGASRRGIKDFARAAICKSRLLSDVVEETYGKGLTCGTEIELVWEQQARAENRIELSQTKTDGFGVPRPLLYWEKSPLDYRTAKVAMELLGRHLAGTGHGWVRSFDHIIEAKSHPVQGWMAGHHHMGGTRMADRQEIGVVDANLKVFGMDNTYVLGSSVFPTAGHANPTYTIVQLAVRLGRHLALRPS